MNVVAGNAEISQPRRVEIKQTLKDGATGACCFCVGDPGEDRANGVGRRGGRN